MLRKLLLGLLITSMVAMVGCSSGNDKVTNNTPNETYNTNENKEALFNNKDEKEYIKFINDIMESKSKEYKITDSGKFGFELSTRIDESFYTSDGKKEIVEYKELYREFTQKFGDELGESFNFSIFIKDTEDSYISIRNSNIDDDKICINKSDNSGEFVKLPTTTILTPGNYVVGKDIKAGKYDLVAADEDCLIRSTNSVDLMVMLGKENKGGFVTEFKNAKFEDGIEFKIEFGSVELTSN